MDWLSKLIVVDNLGCPKCKRNSADFWKKKNLPSNKEDMLESLTLIESYSRTITMPLSPRFLLVRLCALTSFSSVPMSPRFLLSAPLSPHHLGSAFSNSTSFWVRLWALTTWVMRFLTLPPFECTIEPSLIPGKSPITIRPFLHLGRSPITTRPLFFFSFWVGHPLQWDHSSTWVGHPLQHDHSSFFSFWVGHPLQFDHSPCFFIWVGHPLQRDHFSTRVGYPLQHDHSSFFSILGRSPIIIRPFSMFFYLGRSPITMRSFLHLGKSPITIWPLFIFFHFG